MTMACDIHPTFLYTTDFGDHMFRLLLLSSLFIGCGKKPGTYSVNSATEATNSDALTKADAMWEQRGDKEKLTETLGLYEQALTADPTNKHVLGRLIRGWYFMGDAHETEKETKMAHSKKMWGK